MLKKLQKQYQDRLVLKRKGNDMKKLLLIAVLFLGTVPSHAGELILDYEDIIIPADSKNVRIDTVYSLWKEMSLGRFFNYAIEAMPWASGIWTDTDWTDDSMFFHLEMKLAGSSVTTLIELDTLYDNGGVLGATIYDADATVLPSWARLRLIHWDSIGVGDADSALVDSAKYVKRVKLLYNWR